MNCRENCPFKILFRKNVRRIFPAKKIPRKFPKECSPNNSLYNEKNKVFIYLYFLFNVLLCLF